MRVETLLDQKVKGASDSVYKNFAKHTNNSTDKHSSSATSACSTTDPQHHRDTRTTTDT
jgi:hypothetical protein